VLLFWGYRLSGMDSATKQSGNVFRFRISLSPLDEVFRNLSLSLSLSLYLYLYLYLYLVALL